MTRDELHKVVVQGVLDDAMRWRKLVRLIGTPANGSHTRVTLSWDDATNTRWIQVENKNYHSEHGTFSNILDTIADDPEELGLR